MLTTKKPNKESIPICKIIDKSDDKFEQLVYVNYDFDDCSNKSDDENDKMKLTDKNKYFVSLPYVVPNQMISLTITGKNGSGKSYYCASYLKLLRETKQYKKSEIYLFTNKHDDDPAYEKIKDMYKIDINNPNLFDLTYDEFADKIVVFDDIERIPDDLIKNFIFKMLNTLLELARSQKTVIITIVHELNNNNQTKTLKNESSDIILFPFLSPKAFMKYCQNELRMSDKEIKALRKNLKPTRSCHVRQSIPSFILSDKFIMLI